MMPLTRLTTVDNPFDPIDQFDQWYVWDTAHGYHTLSYQARVTRSSHELSEADQDLAIEQAMDEIVMLNGGLYKKVVEATNDSQPNLID
jgi:hypothetical protein